MDSLVNNSGGHITFSGGFYFINDTLIISQSDTLKILNNYIIKLAGLSFINVLGTIYINPPDSVKFTAIDTNNKYIGFRLDTLAGSSLFKKMIMEYGNSIRLISCSPLIDSCILRYNTYYASGLASGTISLFRSNSVISHCRIFRNRRAAIVSGANIPSSPVITDNVIYENDVENYNTPQINLGAANPQPVIIRNNIIRGGPFNMSGGIAIFPIGSVPILIIENNIIKLNRYGITLANVNINAYINNNIIDSNNIQGLPMQGGSGINFNGNSSIIAIVTRNKIRWNLWGVTIQGTAKPNLGNIFNADTTDIGLNVIHHNTNVGGIFDLFNNTPDSIKAENNFWGTTNLDSIEAHIFHKPDSAVLGFVDYIPIGTSIGIISNTSEIPAKYYLNNVYPNPFNPSTTISFALPVKSFVSIIITDVTGREVDVLVNKVMTAGSYYFKWNPVNNPSGIYFCRMISETFSDTKKLVLIK